MYVRIWEAIFRSFLSRIWQKIQLSNCLGEHFPIPPIVWIHRHKTFGFLDALEDIRFEQDSKHKKMVEAKRIYRKNHVSKNRRLGFRTNIFAKSYNWPIIIINNNTFAFSTTLENVHMLNFIYFF